MEDKLFWLILVEDSKVVVSLDKKIGSIEPWDAKNPDSIKQAVDTSLSNLAEKNSVKEEDEPDQASFVIPPLWVDKDNNITANKLSLLGNLCRSLHLKPVGFLAYDDAILEDFSQRESFPCSFILLHLNHQVFHISIAYLGKITHRVQGFFHDGFNVADIEQTLFGLKTDSALPPQIILLGDIDDEKINAIRNYSWIGKKNIETFLHLPDVNFISIDKSLSIFTDIINKQISSSTTSEKDEYEDSLPAEEQEEKKADEQDVNSEELPPTDEAETQNAFNIFTEVSKESLNFSSEIPPAEEAIPPVIQEIPPEPEIVKPSKKQLTKIKLPQVNLPKIKLPKFKVKKKLFFVLFPLLIVFILTYFFLYKTKINLYATPYEFTKTVKINLSTQEPTSNKNIKVSSKEIVIPIESSIPTTGSKIDGKKAKGEVTVYNKSEESIEFEQGAIFLDDTGKNFILLNDINVPASTNDLDEGVIKLGQVRAVLEAAEIGPEYNIPKDTDFKHKTNNSVIVKSDEEFVGGTKEEKRAVAKQDMVNLEKIIKEDIDVAVNKKIEEETNILLGAIPESLLVNQQKINFNRQVGEEADELVGDVNSNVNIFILNPEDKQEFILQNFASDEEFNQAILDLDKVDLNFEFTTLDSKFATGQVTISGNLLPKIDIGQFKRQIKGKTFTNLEKVIIANRRIYNHERLSNLKFFDFIKLLPFRLENISIEVKL
jgi:hypothetical protein